jgi:hypothetical protein
MQRGTNSQVRERIDAPPEAIYDLVADVTWMGEWSPECIGCEWVDGATGPAVGARFRGRHRSGLARWSTSREWSPLAAVRFRGSRPGRS